MELDINVRGLRPSFNGASMVEADDVGVAAGTAEGFVEIILKETEERADPTAI